MSPAVKKGVSVCIIDYGLGNLTSVRNAFKLLGVDPIVSDDRKTIKNATHLVLPGVGAFGEGMTNLKKKDLVSFIRGEVLDNKKKILGVCLGMQLFATKGFEHGEHEGLDLIPGEVVKIDNKTSGLRLPQIGWNDVKITGKHKINKGFKKSPIFYFVHSFHFIPKNKKMIAGLCNYGSDIVATLESGNIVGVQFHPEKSYKDGLNILKNFLNL